MAEDKSGTDPKSGGFKVLKGAIRGTFQSMADALDKLTFNPAVADWAMRVHNQKVEEEISLSPSERQFLVLQLTSFAVAVELGTVTRDLVQEFLQKLDARQ
jgi:hypothetical protein